MTDIFVSYSSKDVARVRPICEQLAATGFEVFWDQALPAGIDWDTWIRQHLSKAKCAVVIWSEHSAVSDNVRHEATVAKQQGKFVSVLIDPLTAEQFPMGLYAVQAANLMSWTGSTSDSEWRKLQHAVESKLTPLWVRQMLDGYEAELVAERARREVAERRDKTLRDQIGKEVTAQAEFKRERDTALDEVAILKARVEELERSRPQPEEPQAESQRKIGALERRISELEIERDRLRSELAGANQRPGTPGEPGARLWSKAPDPPGQIATQAFVVRPTWFIGHAVTLMVMGLFAVAVGLIFPYLFYERASGLFLLLVGAAQVLNAFAVQRNALWIFLVGGLACVLAGIACVLGIRATLAFGLAILIDDAMRVTLAFKFRALASFAWKWLLMIGVAGILAGGLIFMNPAPIFMALSFGLIYGLTGFELVRNYGKTTAAGTQA